jgi:hypothetical protein
MSLEIEYSVCLARLPAAEPGQFGAAFGWSWGKYGGPAQQDGLNDIRFRVRVLSPTKLEVGFGYGYARGWRMRTLDVSRFGKITVVWEIGPILSLDPWMADDLTPRLDIYPTPVLDAPNPGNHTYSIASPKKRMCSRAPGRRMERAVLYIFIENTVYNASTENGLKEPVESRISSP